MNIEKIVKNDFIFYKTQLLKIFKENYFENGGMLYSDDFLTNSDYIFIVKQNNKIIAYMAISKLTEKELDRKFETYMEEPILENSILIKHLVVKKEYRRQKIATQLLKYIKEYSSKNGIKSIYLWTTPDNTIALNLYEKHKFYKIGDFNPTEDIFHGLKDFHSIMMVYHTKGSSE